MSWIHTISPDQASGKLDKIYKRVAGADGNIDNILQVHSLRPHTLQGHMTLYKSVLHHSGNTLPKTTLELLGVWVSLLNKCDYCVAHHFAGLKSLMADSPAADLQLDALRSGYSSEIFDTGTQAMLAYAEALTLAQGKVKHGHVKAMRKAGLDDGQILEVNQVVAYFNYANRTIIGLGVELHGDKLGESPGDSADEENWQHTPAEKLPSSSKESSKHSMRGSVASKQGYKPTIRTVHGQAFSTRHIQLGDPWFDLFFRLTAGVCIGGAIGRVSFFGAGTMVKIERFWPSHPMSDGVAYGFFAAVPVCILYYVWRKWHVAGALKSGAKVPDLPRFVGRSALVLTALGTFGWLKLVH